MKGKGDEGAEGSEVREASARNKTAKDDSTLPKGYKRTEVGVIPEEWEEKAFKELFRFSNGVNTDKGSYGKGVRFINVLEPITYSHLYGPEIPGRVSINPVLRSIYSVKKGDVLFNRTSETDEEIGLAGVYLGIEEVVFGGFVIRGRPSSELLHPEYSGYSLRGYPIRSQVIPLGQGAIRANISQQSLKQILLPLPPLPEQRAIAEALGDVDALLSSLDGLIAKKRHLKQASMQELLTGKKRLPGFCGEWEVKKLGEVAEIATGNTPPTSDFSNYGDEFLFVSPVDLGACKFILNTEKKLSKKGFAISRRFPKGSILFVCIGSTIGKCGIAEIELTSNQQINAIFPSDYFSIDYLFYLICNIGPKIRAQASEQAVPIINKSQFSETDVTFPSLLEQSAIAAVLSDMDAEITALEARREKTQALKQAMMQELLTGKTRLI